MPFSYANPTSGPSAGGIGWFNFGSLTMNPGDTVNGLTGTLHDGTIIRFDMTMTLVSGAPRQFTATTVPTYPIAQFGAAGYTDLTGNVAMYADLADGNTSVTSFTLSNITAKDSLGNPIPNYTVLIADAETTNLFEGIGGETDGENWTLFTAVGTGGSPTLTGTGTQTFQITGIDQPGQMVAYVLSTQSPDQVVITLTDLDPVQTRQGFAVGFATTRLTLQKDIGSRIDSTDQFDLDITGNPADQATTTGSAAGIQKEFARVYVSPGSMFDINEDMAPGSTSALTDYTQILSASNATPAGSIPPITNLPIAFTPSLGDDVTYTILNAAPETFLKTVNKSYADLNEVLTYSVTVNNPNHFAINNVLVTDPLPAGTTYLGNLSVSAPYTGTDPASGITITTIGPDSSVILRWQVQVNTVPPIPNPVPNYAQITVPGGTSGMTNVVTTQVNTAHVSILKTVDRVFATIGDILTYTLTLKNAGNVSANQVIITDTIPEGTTFVPNSVTGATGTPPTLTLANPIPAGGTAVVTFQVKADSLPKTNSIPNQAFVSYRYTVNPDQPNGNSGNGQSNNVTTQISTACLPIQKSVDKNIAYPGSIITYKLSFTNTGNTAANNVVLTDNLPAGLTYVPGSITSNVPVTGTPNAIHLTNPVAPGQIVAISFQAKVTSIPLPNPAVNQAVVTYKYSVNPSNPDVSGTNTSNQVCTLVFRYNFSQQITDLVESAALQQAALAAIANAEGSKIQKMASRCDVTTHELLEVNQSVENMLDSISLLETIIRQKLKVVECQIQQSCNK